MSVQTQVAGQTASTEGTVEKNGVSGIASFCSVTCIQTWLLHQVLHGYPKTICHWNDLSWDSRDKVGMGTEKPLAILLVDLFQCQLHKCHYASLNTEHDRQALCSCSAPLSKGVVCLFTSVVRLPSNTDTFQLLEHKVFERKMCNNK